MRDMDALDNPEGDKTVSISQSCFSQTTHDLWLWHIGLTLVLDFDLSAGMLQKLQECSSKEEMEIDESDTGKFCMIQVCSV